MIYFDNSATSAPYPEVLKVYQDVAQKYFGNPSSLHSLGTSAAKLLNQSRHVASEALGGATGDIIFTSGGTESNNMAIKGIALQYSSRGKHIIMSSVEHASVYETGKQLEGLGFRITYLPVDSTGRVDPADVEQAMQDDTILVSVMYVNSELGTIQPVAEIGSILARFPKVFFHVDAVQGFGKLPVEPARWGVDLLSLSAHKFHGPRGIGLLYMRKGIVLSPLLSGGGQEDGKRSGTENLPAIVAMAKAMRMQHQSLAANRKHMTTIRTFLIEQLESFPGCLINGPGKGSPNAAPHIVNFSFPGLKSEVVVHALEEKEIYLSTRSACSSRQSKPSRVLLAAGLDEARASSALRVSLSEDNTMVQAKAFISALNEVIPNLAKIMRV
ncbi:cysteine desulfurase family protein [Aneurinibacillus sp. Ricciae_BoGa-3]|uniref:cysteine desulfurase family protein n=1 Tax=Aneurinibacillus sp. Ricciae_BoGa-3 TaxID=3022697 RepID=UPI00233FF94E|nr:cysteine desulfurase family protein [Aneurinibacillus sp. Ricciae_BoGa-3]WCK55810.1 cysteine desulfurase family protein [Aneurinibacillus sp. Ricciae_BoGa-3]